MLKKIKNFFTYPITDHKINYKKLLPRHYNWDKIRNGLKIFVIFMAGVTLTVITADYIYFDFFGANNEPSENIANQVIDHLDSYYFTPEDIRSDCNLKVITLQGTLLTYIPASSYDESGKMLYDETSSDDIVLEINDAEESENIKAIILEIDSTGGSAVAAEEIYTALKNAGKPTVALIREYGDSAAYYAAAGADYIIANKNSDIGSIGATYSYLDNSQKNQKDGLTYNQISTGKFKDIGNPDKPLTAEEKALLLRDANIIKENFIKTVAEGRKLDIEKVRKIADGSSMLGEMALANGLIDKVGGAEEAKAYLAEKTGEDINVCEMD